MLLAVVEQRRPQADRGDFIDRGESRFEGVEVEGATLLSLWYRVSLQRGGSDHAERPLGADEESRQVGARRVPAHGAGAKQRPVRQRHLDRDRAWSPMPP